MNLLYYLVSCFFWYLRVLKGGSDDDDMCFFWCVVAVGCGRAPGCQNSREADLVSPITLGQGDQSRQAAGLIDTFRVTTGLAPPC